MNLDKEIDREYIMNLEAGREMDRLVAENVMGWEWVVPEPTKNWISLPYAWDKVNDEPRYEWYPSTDISSAWEVVEKMRLKGYRESVHTYDDYYNVVVTKNKGMDDREVSADVRASTAPLAICRAALLTTIQGE